MAPVSTQGDQTENTRSLRLMPAACRPNVTPVVGFSGSEAKISDFRGGLARPEIRGLFGRHRVSRTHQLPLPEYGRNLSCKSQRHRTM